MQHSSAHTAFEDSSSGTPVSLVVAPQQAVPGQTTPGHTAPPPHRSPLPFTGLDLVPTLVLAAVLLATGTLLSQLTRRPAPVRVRADSHPLPAARHSDS